MTKKIKAITAAAIAVIVVCTFCALAVVNGNSINDVKKVNMAENSSSSVKIQWSAVKGAEGYLIYAKDDSGDYEKIGEPGAEDTSYDFTGLNSATVYSVKVTAFKHFGNKLVESEEAQEFKIFTLPDAPELTADSPDEGVLSLNWKKIENASGYELEYSKDKEFGDSESEEFPQDRTELKIDGLTPKDVYFARVRAFFDPDGDKVFGEWSKTAETEIMEKVVMAANLDPNKPMIALSFDDGPGYPNGSSPNPTKEILDVLEEYGARATFFMVSSRIGSSNIDCLKREIALGCELGNHTYSHERYGKKVTANDIKKCSETIKEKTGQAPTIFRCTGGMITSAMQEECRKEGMPIAYWSIDTEDWKSKNPDKIYDITMKNAYDGAIILMHDIYPTTAQAVKKIVPALIEQGYQVVGISEMLAAKNGGKPPKVGEQYVDYKTINNHT